jgi:hypothetical protein
MATTAIEAAIVTAAVTTVMAAFPVAFRACRYR